VIGVALDKDASATADFVKSHQLTFIILQDIDGKAVGEAYRSWKMPEAYLIDAAGKVDAVYLGSVRWRSPEVRERIESVLPPAPERVK
jgi:peroxiredoxin